ncbi:26040_t:CDS:10 [Gigaspora margarita]|uniref:26040_t:CDS:1 n=1 Tax=Gigaspora margarita TaxID=4874 RepID=A0ABM8VVS2_GIGMA|nr:26040_t:CDS:10 [Gigaspora margarita]
MVETIEDKKEIVRSSINLIWEATDGGIKKIVFNNQSRSAAIFLSDGTEDTENLNAPGAVLISEETYRKIINDLADMKGKKSIATEDNLDSDNLSQVDELMFDAQASENDTLNLEEGQHTEDSHINDYFKTSKRTKNNNASKYPHVNENQEQRDNVNNDFEETDKLLPDSHSLINVTVNTSQAVSTDNQISIDNECVTDNQLKITENWLNLLPDSHSPINVTVNTSQAVSIDNQISPDNECVTDNQHVDESMLNDHPNDHPNDQPNDQPSINVISGMLEQTNLAENSTLADDIESIQDNNYEEDFDFAENSKNSKRKIYKFDKRSVKKNKRLKKKYEKQLYTSESDHEESQNIKFSKKKTMNLNKKSTSLSDPLAPHNDSSTDDSAENRVGSANFPIVLIEKDERFSNNISNEQNIPITNELVNEDSSPINQYFKKEVFEVSTEPEPFPKIMEDVRSCSEYLKIWDLHYNNCNRLIEIQDLKKLELIYSLAKVFFTMIKICYQEQVKDMSLAKNTNTWKGRDIKSRMNKFWNTNSRTMLIKWTSCWRLCHFLWVTNITPKEMVKVKLKADFFRNATESEYNFLIKELLGQGFPNFSNIKDEKILDLVEIAKKICK